MVAVPKYVADAAKRGLDLLEYKGSGLTPKTVREARELAAGTASPDKVRRMAAWFARHTGDLSSPDAQAYVRGDKDRPTPGQVAWLLWGGPLGDSKLDGMKWAEKETQRLINAGELSKGIMPFLRGNREQLVTDNLQPVPIDAQNPIGLVPALQEMYSNVVVLYFSAHRAHWNVTGQDFSQYHALFAEIYEDIYGSIDPFAENIRKLKGFPPGINAAIGQADFEDASLSTGTTELATDLLTKNRAVLAMLKVLFQIANNANEQGVANFIAERIDQHHKWEWQLSASLGI